MHDLLESNPYWLLGLPGNATRREIVTTASRLRLRRVAGRDLQVEDPLNDSLGIPSVTVAQFDALVRQLDDPRLRLRHRLLRYTRATRADETAWREMLSKGNGLAVLAAWPRQGNLATRLNRARWMWWDCHGYVSDVEKPWWRECLILWSRIVDDPGFFAALAPEAVEATFDQPATEADFQAAVEVVPVLLEQMFEYVTHAHPPLDEVVAMTDAVRYAMLPERWTQQLFEKLWARYLGYAESAVEEFEESDAASVNDCRMEYIDRMHDLEKLGAEGTPLAKRIRRRMGKSLHAKALFFEKNGPLVEAVSCIRFSRYLLDGTPDVVPVRPDEVRIVELATKAAAPPPPPLTVQTSSDVTIPPPAAVRNEPGYWTAGELYQTLLLTILAWCCIAIAMYVYPVLLWGLPVLGLLRYVGNILERDLPRNWVRRFNFYLPQEIRYAVLTGLFAATAMAGTLLFAEAKPPALKAMARPASLSQDQISAEVNLWLRKVGETRRATLEYEVLRQLPKSKYGRRAAQAVSERDAGIRALPGESQQILIHMADYNHSLPRGAAPHYEVTAFAEVMDGKRRWARSYSPKEVFQQVRQHLEDDLAVELEKASMEDRAVNELIDEGESETWND